MAKKQREKAPADKRKPKHSNDQNRSNSKQKNGMRDAATVRPPPARGRRRKQACESSGRPFGELHGIYTPRMSLLERELPLQRQHFPAAAATAAASCRRTVPFRFPFLPLQVRRLAMYNNKAKRDKKGRIISQDFQSKELPSTRIQPDRRWFGNTRVIGQKQLEAFREEMGAKVGAGNGAWRGS